MNVQYRSRGYAAPHYRCSQQFAGCYAFGITLEKVEAMARGLAIKAELYYIAQIPAETQSLHTWVGRGRVGARGPNPKGGADPRGPVSFTRNSQHHQGPQVRPLRRFFPPSSPFLFLQHDSFRTGALGPWGHTHRVSPSTDSSFHPCSGCLTL